MERSHEAYLRIGELGRRTGVSPELLRAWERRYAVIEPARSKGGFRLYTDRDVERLRAMRAYVDAGIAPAQAAHLAVAVPAAPPPDQVAGTASALPQIAESLWGSLEALDEAGVHAAFDRALASFSVELVIRDLVLPYLRELGECWARGDAGIAQEHFSSNLLRGRLLGLARGWGQGYGPQAVLACPPGELHDLGLLCFGLLLRSNGWRVTYLGADTPIEVLAHVAKGREADLVVVTAVTTKPLRAAAWALAALAGDLRIAIAGEGATPALAEAIGASLLAGDPVTAARDLTAPTRA